MRSRTQMVAASVLTFCWVAACSGSDDPSTSSGGGVTPPPGPPEGSRVDPPKGVVRPLTQPSHGSTISLSEDDAHVVVANTDIGTASVFAVDYSAALPSVKKTGDVAVGAEPGQVVIHPNGVSAFMLVRKDQKVVRIDDLAGTPKKGAEVRVGSEPTGIAIEPTGKTIWVTNWVDGTVMGIATDTMQVTTTVDLNATLAASGLLGSGIAARPALAHPRAIAMTPVRTISFMP